VGGGGREDMVIKRKGKGEGWRLKDEEKEGGERSRGWGGG